MCNSRLEKFEALILANTIRELCVEKAREGFTDASMQGLCAEGSMEAAVSSIQLIDIEQVLNDFFTQRS